MVDPYYDEPEYEEHDESEYDEDEMDENAYAQKLANPKDPYAQTLPAGVQAYEVTIVGRQTIEVYAADADEAAELAMAQLDRRRVAFTPEQCRTSAS